MRFHYNKDNIPNSKGSTSSRGGGAVRGGRLNSKQLGQRHSTPNTSHASKEAANSIDKREMQGNILKAIMAILITLIMIMNT